MCVRVSAGVAFPLTNKKIAPRHLRTPWSACAIWRDSWSNNSAYKFYRVESNTKLPISKWHGRCVLCRRHRHSFVCHVIDICLIKITLVFFFVLPSGFHCGKNRNEIKWKEKIQNFGFRWPARRGKHCFTFFYSYVWIYWSITMAKQ